jgi:hypothetical protein
VRRVTFEPAARATILNLSGNSATILSVCKRKEDEFLKQI